MASEYRLFNLEDGFFYVVRHDNLTDAIGWAELLGYDVAVYRCGSDGQVRIGTWNAVCGYAAD